MGWRERLIRTSSDPSLGKARLLVVKPSGAAIEAATLQLAKGVDWSYVKTAERQTSLSGRVFLV